MALFPHRVAQAGLTLIELCCVIAVIAVLAAIAVPNLRDLLEARRLEGAAGLLAADIRFARSEALARNARLRLSLQETAHGVCYVIHSGGPDTCRCGAQGLASCQAGAHSLRAVLLTSADRVRLEANSASMVFDPRQGTVSPAGTLKLSGTGSRAIHHVVNVMGRLRSCSPRGVVPGYRAC